MAENRETRLPLRQDYDGGSYYWVPETVDFAATTAPGGEPWADFIDKAYQGITWAKTHDESVEPNPYWDYAVYWNDLYPAIGGDFGRNPVTQERTQAASPEFEAARTNLSPQLQEQVGYNIEAMRGDRDQFNIFGDQFFQALMALGAATGGAAAFGGFAAPGALGAGAAAAADPLALGGAAGGVTGTGAGIGTAGAGGAASAGAGIGAGGLGGGGMASWFDLIPSLINAGTSIAGGVMGSQAARDAARTQAGSAEEANRLLWDIYQQNRSDLAPFREAGTAALGGLAGLAGQPFTAAPFDASGLAFTPPSGQQVLNDDPGYNWRIQQGMKALEGGAAARGGLLSGGTVQAAQRFGQDLASQEYGNAYGRALGQNQLRYGRARDEYLTNLGLQKDIRNMNFNELAALAGIGQTAGSNQAQLGAQVGGQLAGNITSGGAAGAAGQIGSSNAWMQALGGLGSTANSYMNQQLVQQQLNQQNQQQQALMDLFRTRR